MKCANCKYWGVDYDGVCDRIELSYYSDLRHPSDALIDGDAHDDSGLYARLITGPDFGCNLFQEKQS